MPFSFPGVPRPADFPGQGTGSAPPAFPAGAPVPKSAEPTRRNFFFGIDTGKKSSLLHNGMVLAFIYGPSMSMIQG